MFFKIKEVLDYIASPVYRARGQRPWSPGYFTAKKNAIGAGIDKGVFKHGEALPARYGYRIDERVVEYPWLYSQLPQNPGKVLDAGSTLNFQYLLNRAPAKQADLTIMTLAPEKRCFWNRSISYVFGDLRNTQFADDVLDVVLSVSTIEHIGLDNTLLYTGDASKKESDCMGFVPAVREFKRVLRPGGLCLITVPFGKPGVHGWYQVFDQELVMKIVESFQTSDFSIDYFGYKNSGWQRAEPEDIAKAEFFDIHEGRSFDDDFAAGARGVACIRLVA
jgi:SAM-dependent methyltransferase